MCQGANLAQMQDWRDFAAISGAAEFAVQYKHK